jgi:hypothetical protein
MFLVAKDFSRIWRLKGLVHFLYLLLCENIPCIVVVFQPHVVLCVELVPDKLELGRIGSAQLLLHGTDLFAWVVGGRLGWWGGGMPRVLWLLCSRCAVRDMGSYVLHFKHLEMWKMFTLKQAESELDYKVMLCINLNPLALLCFWIFRNCFPICSHHDFDSIFMTQTCE